MKPLGDKVLIKLMEAPTHVGRILLPEQARETPSEAIVVAVGAGRLDTQGNRIPIEVNVGDKIIINKYGKLAIEYKGEQHYLLVEDDILAVLG